MDAGTPRPEKEPRALSLASVARDESGVGCDALGHVLQADPAGNTAASVVKQLALSDIDGAHGLVGGMRDHAGKQQHTPRVGHDCGDFGQVRGGHCFSSGTQKSKKLNH